MIRSTLALGGAIGLLAFGAAQAQDIRNLAPAAAPGHGTISDLTGLVGRWVYPLGELDFSAPVGGQLVGHEVTMDDKGAPRLEELWIFRAEGGSVLLRQKAFDGALSERRDKDQFLERRLIAVEHGSLFFENITLTPKGDTLQVDVRLLDPTRVLKMVFQRVK